MSKHIYKFSHIHGNTSVIMTSHELEPETLEKYLDAFGAGYSYTVESFANDCARVVADTAEIDALKTRIAELERCLVDCGMMGEE